MDTLPEVTAVNTNSDFTLTITFANGEIRQFDMRPYLDRGIFTRLKNLGLFALARVEHGTIAWPGGLDIAPETLYLKSTEMSQKPSAA